MDGTPWDEQIRNTEAVRAVGLEEFHAAVAAFSPQLDAPLKGRNCRLLCRFCYSSKEDGMFLSLCPACGKSVNIPEEMIGKTVVCPLCNSQFEAKGPPPPDPIIEAFSTSVAEQMRNGVAPTEIEKSLIKQGLDARAAARVINHVKQTQAKALKEAGYKNMLFGALWCIGGIAVTALTFQAAAGSGGGTYLIAWGAILFGVIQLFRGVMQASGE